jgi:hypothetical protein
MPEITPAAMPETPWPLGAPPADIAARGGISGELPVDTSGRGLPPTTVTDLGPAVSTPINPEASGFSPVSSSDDVAAALSRNLTPEGFNYPIGETVPVSPIGIGPINTDLPGAARPAFLPYTEVADPFTGGAVQIPSDKYGYFDPAGNYIDPLSPLSGVTSPTGDYLPVSSPLGLGAVDPNMAPNYTNVGYGTAAPMDLSLAAPDLWGAGAGTEPGWLGGTPEMGLPFGASSSISLPETVLSAIAAPSVAPPAPAEPSFTLDPASLITPYVPISNIGVTQGPRGLDIGGSRPSAFSPGYAPGSAGPVSLGPDVSFASVGSFGDPGIAGLLAGAAPVSYGGIFGGQGPILLQGGGVVPQPGGYPANLTALYDREQLMKRAPGLLLFPTYPKVPIDAPKGQGVEGSGTFYINGKHYILPTVVNGVRYEDEDAVNRFKATGEHLGAFKTDKEAQAFEEKFFTPEVETQPHEEQEMQEGGVVKPTKKQLRDYERIHGFPYHPGPQFAPRLIPIEEDPLSGNRYYEPYEGSQDLELMAQSGGVVPQPQLAQIPGTVLDEYGVPIPITLPLRGPRYKEKAKPTSSQSSGGLQNLAGGLSSLISSFGGSGGSGSPTVNDVATAYGQSGMMVRRMQLPKLPIALPQLPKLQAPSPFHTVIPPQLQMHLPSFAHGVLTGQMSAQERKAMFAHMRKQFGGLIDQEDANPAAPNMPIGTDTVPLMATPGEMMLTKKQQRAVKPIPGKEKDLRPDQRAAFKKMHGGKSHG